jgi:thioredoxin-like negative regulator of GroEL
MKFVSLAAIMIGLFWVDRFLAQLEQSEVQKEAAGLAMTANQLLASGKAPEAVVRYRRAHFLIRKNRDYALGYAQALLTAKDVTAAESLLGEQLDQNSNDAPTNLAMARVMIAKGSAAEADSFYHRAIYGVWPNGAVANQEQVRMELAEWLAKRGAKDELLAELLPLQAAALDDSVSGRKVAELLLAAGSPARAADQYRALIGRNPADLAAYRGLGEAELKRGNYTAAQRALLDAVRRDGTDVASAKRLQMVSVLISLDPTPRRLPAGEKYERSKRLLARVQDALQICGTPAAANQSGQTAEAQLTLAELLWRGHAAACTAAQQDEPLKFVMDKLTSN